MSVALHKELIAQFALEVQLYGLTVEDAMHVGFQTAYAQSIRTEHLLLQLMTLGISFGKHQNLVDKGAYQVGIILQLVGNIALFVLRKV